MAFAYHTSVEALQCYVCTLEQHSACEDPFDKDRAERAGLISTCPEATGEGQRTLCRKTTQEVEEDYIISRACGYTNTSTDCYTSLRNGISVKSCQCFEDLCNAAPPAVALFASNWLTLAVVTALVVKLID